MLIISFPSFSNPFERLLNHFETVLTLSKMTHKIPYLERLHGSPWLIVAMKAGLQHDGVPGTFRTDLAKIAVKKAKAAKKKKKGGRSGKANGSIVGKITIKNGTYSYKTI